MIDTHAHLDFSPLNTETDNVIQRAKDTGVSIIINIGANIKTSQNSIDLAEKYENVFAAVGVHPNDVAELGERKNRDLLEKMLQQPKVKAMGEIGLDYFRLKPGDEKTKELQKKYFVIQLQLAKKYNLPVIIHSRNSMDDTLRNIEREKPDKAVLHCYAYDLQTALRFLSLSIDYMISFTGIVTFPNARATQRVATEIPLNRIMIETDCPFLAPQVYRGKTNEPSYVVEVAKKIAELKNIPLAEVEQITDQNAHAFFSL